MRKAAIGFVPPDLITDFSFTPSVSTMNTSKVKVVADAPLDKKEAPLEQNTVRFSLLKKLIFLFAVLVIPSPTYAGGTVCGYWDGYCSFTYTSQSSWFTTNHAFRVSCGSSTHVQRWSSSIWDSGPDSVLCDWFRDIGGYC